LKFTRSTHGLHEARREQYGIRVYNLTGFTLKTATTFRTPPLPRGIHDDIRSNRISIADHLRCNQTIDRDVGRLQSQSPLLELFIIHLLDTYRYLHLSD